MQTTLDATTWADTLAKLRTETGLEMLDGTALQAAGRWLAQLTKAAQRTNLIAKRSPLETAEIAFVDAWMCLDAGWLDGCAQLLDVGSGAGMPGLPLALGAPHTAVTLLEPRRLRVSFLEDCIRNLNLGARVQVQQGKLASFHGERAALGTARAVLPPAEWLEEGQQVAERLVSFTTPAQDWQAPASLHCVDKRAYALPVSGAARIIQLWAAR